MKMTFELDVIEMDEPDSTGRSTIQYRWSQYSTDTAIVPASKEQYEQWYKHSVKSHVERLRERLKDAEERAKGLGLEV